MDSDDSGGGDHGSDLVLRPRADHGALVGPASSRPGTPAATDRNTEREMRLIFERAGEAAAAADGERRYSLAEIQEIAVQAGLDPKDVARAAATVRTPASRSVMFGAPLRFRDSRVVNCEMHEADILEVVLKIREQTGLHGELRDVPGGMEWRARSSLGQMIVDFARTTNGTRIDVLVAREDQAALIAIGTGFAGLLVGVAGAMEVGVALHAGVALGLAAGTAAAIGTAWGATRLWWRRIARRWSGEASALTGTVAESIEEGAVQRKLP